MAVVLPIGDGPRKREIVELSYGECGLTADFNIDAEEYTDALRRLNAMMREWEGMGIALSYNFPSAGVGDPDEASGIPYDTLQAAALGLAVRLAPPLGVTLSPETKGQAAKSLAYVRGAYMPVVAIEINPGTVRGSGREFGWYRRW